MTPTRKTESDIEDMSKSMKLSRVHPHELNMIESSIRQSFMSTGKRPPQFKPLNELQLKEEYERDIQRLKEEKDVLAKENIKLERELKGNQQLVASHDKGRKEHLEQLITQQQEKIDALQEEVMAL